MLNNYIGTTVKGTGNRIFGHELYVNDIITVKKEYVQFRFPKRKNRRIQNKYKKMKRNFKIEEKYFAFATTDKIFIHSKHYEKLISNKCLIDVNDSTIEI